MAEEDIQLRVTPAEFQDLFSGRYMLVKARDTLLTYGSLKDASIYFSFTDSHNQRKNVSIPLQTYDLIPILNKYIDKVDKEIMARMGDINYGKYPVSPMLYINNEDEFKTDLENEIKNGQVGCVAHIEEITYALRDMYYVRMQNPHLKDIREYWTITFLKHCDMDTDRCYVFELIMADKYSLTFKYLGIKNVNEMYGRK